MGKGRGGIEAGYGELFFSRTYDFLEVYLVGQAGRSEHTRKSHELGLGALYDYVTGQLAIPPGRFTFRLCTYELLLGWSQHMQGAAGLANGTVNSRLAAVRAYLRYAADGDPSPMSVWLATRKVPTPPTPKRQRPVIEAGDLAAFLDAPERTRIGNRGSRRKSWCMGGGRRRPSPILECRSDQETTERKRRWSAPIG